MKNERGPPPQIFKKIQGGIRSCMSLSKAFRCESACHFLDAGVLSWYIDNMKNSSPSIERVQTGVRIEARLLKVLKAVAELRDLSLGDLLEGIVLHAFEGKVPFSDDTLAQIAVLKAVYGLDLTAADAHQVDEGGRRDGI
jgi:hypothetical protein